MKMGYGEWNDTKYSLPDEGVRVLIFDGNVQVAKLVKGISEKEREKMKNGEMPDDFCELWSKNKVISVRRSEIYRKGDEFGNNLVPYQWEACGFPRDWWGQDVTHWMPLPDVPCETRERHEYGNVFSRAIIGALACGFIGNNLLKDEKGDRNE